MVVEGVVGSSERLWAQTAALQQLKMDLQAVECVEMEGAAVVQVCHEYAVPCAVVRLISKSANESAPVDFPRFARQVAGQYALGILHNLIDGRCVSPATQTVSPGSAYAVNRLRGELPDVFFG